MSDGYADQFGGPELKKFKSKALKQILLDTAHLDMQGQGRVLSEQFGHWKGSYFQIDDVCIVGVEFNR